MRGRVGVFFVAALLWSSVCLAQGQFTGEVVRVADGDTISVLRDGRAVRVRIQGVDCPESAQDFSAKAKQFTSSKVFGKTVSVEPSDIDRYGRTVGRVVVDGEDLGFELLKAGLAWHYKQFSNDVELAHAERAARDARVGLWSLPNPTPPWEFRRPSSYRNKSAIRKNVQGLQQFPPSGRPPRYHSIS